MLLIFLSYLLPSISIAAALYPLLSYLIDRKGLRRFPAPAHAAFSSTWRMFHNFNNKHYLAIHTAHERLGSHVRIAPNHISILDVKAPNDVYGHGANMLKEAWYDAGAGAHRNMADTRVKSEHQAKRKMLAHTFAPKTVVGFEPLLQETIGALNGLLHSHVVSGQAIDMRLALNYFTIDFLGGLLFSKKFGCLQRGDDLLEAETSEGVRYKAPFIQSLLDATVINTLLAFEPGMLSTVRPLVKNHPYKKAGVDWENIVHLNLKQRIQDPSAPSDLFSKLLQDNKGQQLNLSEGELLAECSVMMNAGTETTTAALTNTIYLLYRHPAVLSKLREELDNAFAETEVLTYDTASRLPYLRACIEESLRLRPASSFGLPRVVPPGGRMIAGRFVEGGVTVSVPTYSLLRIPEAFENPDEYVPERWLTEDGEKKRKMLEAHLPFSVGPRACIGRNIAYFEQIVLIATLVKCYDFEIPEGFELETIERFNSNPGSLPVICRTRATP